MTRPVRTSAILPAGTTVSCDAARSNPADSSVPYAGRGTVGSSRRILSRIRAAYLGRLAGSAALLMIVLAGPGLRAQVATPNLASNLNAPFPLDAAIRTGKLPNGLTYFIRHNDQPDNRIVLRLVVKAGSV